MPCAHLLFASCESCYFGPFLSFERLLVTCLGRSDELFQRGVVHVRVPFRIDFIRQDEPRDL
ncbi:MAG: hypothetical protein AUI90_13060 [Deltaproteobacteria bacterium 13_1_40CM_3_69_14]|nr:MAG: hypothetical protein AUI90_13060 [Deltaproteobacteria bacterium 13_1_40CM_3_69_14]